VLDAAKTFMRDHAYLMTKTRVPGVVDVWHCDNAGEFTDSKVESWTAAMGILRSFSIEDVHETNGAAERCALLGRPSMVHACDDCACRWQRAAGPLLAVLDARRRLLPQLLLELRLGRHPHLHGWWWRLRPAQAQGHALRLLRLDQGERDLRSPRAAPCQGRPPRLYDVRRRGYFVYLPDLQRITTACDVEFVENSFSLLSAVQSGVKILKRAHNKELPEALPITAVLRNGLDITPEHPCVIADRARVAAATDRAARPAAARAARPAAAPAAAAAPRPSTPNLGRPATAARRRVAPHAAPRATAAAPPLLPPPPPPPPPPPAAAVAAPPPAPRLDAPSGRTRSAVASAVASDSASLVSTSAYEFDYLQDKNNYSYKPAGSLASDPYDTVLFVGSVMGEAYQIDTNVGIVPIPRSYAAAVADPVYGAKWRAACDDDFEGKYTLLKTWKLVKTVPVGRRVIKGKWIFSVKYKTNGTVDKFKARYVICGYNQVQGVDYVDSFCSTLRLESLRIYLAGACINDDDLLEVDVVKAFPSGDWDGTEMYLQQPPG